MEILQTENLGQNTTIEHVIDTHGHACYRVCRIGMCRFAEDRYYADMYARQFGWSPKEGS